MSLSAPYVSLTKTIAFCAIGMLLTSPSLGQDSHPNDYIRSTRPLKSGGSITTLNSQGQTRSWVNQSKDTAPEAPVASRDTNADQSRSAASTSFYRQSQQSQTRNLAADTYPYPGATLPSTASTQSRFDSDQSAQLRFERAAVGDLNTGDLGNTSSTQSLPRSFGRQAAASTPAARVAQVPAARVAQVPAGSQSRSFNSVVNPNATAAAFNSGPNYVNPNLNFAGYQGYQANALPANSVPALNTNVTRVAQNCCAPNQNCCCTCQPQAQAQSFQPFPVSAQAGSVQNINFQAPQSQGYQWQPNIGVPQLGGSTGGGIGSRFCSWFKGAGSGQSSNSLGSMLSFRNMPPGAYLGQGIIGQPTAYVDGQPFRNLIRYVAP